MQGKLVVKEWELNFDLIKEILITTFSSEDSILSPPLQLKNQEVVK